MTVGAKPIDDFASAPNLPDYRLLSLIGRGTFGEVWLAEERLTGLSRAVKVLRKSTDAAHTLPLRELSGIREYQQKARGHDCLVQVFHVGETSECFYYVMELADDCRVRTALLVHPPAVGGEPIPTAHPRDYRPLTLAALIERDAPVPPGRALDIIIQILRGLDHLHTQGLLHRDVKPSNVLLVNGCIKLGDLGLVTSQDSDVTLVFTPGYAPTDARVDQTSDLYATGIILYEMITGLHRSRFPELPLLSPSTRAERRAYSAAIRVANKAAHPDRRQRFGSARAYMTAIHSMMAPRRPILTAIAIALLITGLLLFLALWLLGAITVERGVFDAR